MIDLRSLNMRRWRRHLRLSLARPALATERTSRVRLRRLACFTLALAFYGLIWWSADSLDAFLFASLLWSIAWIGEIGIKLMRDRVALVDV